MTKAALTNWLELLAKAIEDEDAAKKAAESKFLRNMLAGNVRFVIDRIETEGVQ